MTTTKAKPQTKLKCPICDFDKRSVFKTGIRGDTDAVVYICDRCAHQFLEAPSYDLRSYYSQEYRDNHSYTVGQKMTPREEFEMMKPLMDMRERQFRDHIPEGAKVLEIGSSSGFFLDRIKGDYTVYANEWNPEMAKFSEEELGIPTSTEDLPDAFPNEQFTVICAFHVLEHVADPIAWLIEVKKRLIGGGWIIMEVPHNENAMMTVFNIPEFIEFFYRKPHIHYFNRFGLATVLQKSGFDGSVSMRNTYSLGNLFSWLLTGRPQNSASISQSPMFPVDIGHPADPVMNRLFYRMDREYRNALDTLTACDTLIATARKVEI